MSSINQNKFIAQENKIQEQVKSCECDVDSDVVTLSDEELSAITGGAGAWQHIKNFMQGGWGRNYGARKAQMTKNWGGK